MKLTQPEIRDTIAFLKTLLTRPSKRVKRPVKAPTVFHPRFGIDFSSGTPSLSGLRGSGVTFVGRYLSNESNPKNLRRSEVRAYKRMGLGIVTFWETTARRATEGRAAGERDALAAKRMLEQLGAPAHAVVFFAVDFEDNIDTPVGDYFRGAGHVIGQGRVGVYGGYDVVRRLFDADLVAYACQTYAWSGGAWDHRARLRQFSNDHTIAGVSCDFERAVHPLFGQW